MRYQLLDHGFLEFVESWGTGIAGRNCKGGPAFIGDSKPLENDYEVGIIEAARQSTHGAFRGWGTDAKLLASLYNRKHDTPFEFAGLVIEVQAPIMVFREWHRHRTQSFNEMSARYAPLPDLYYEPTTDDVIERAKAAALSANKQAAGVAPVDETEIAEWMEQDRRLSRDLEDHYRWGLKAGVPKELARKKMPVDHYTKMRAQANLRNWLAFMTLRCDPNAQWEIRQYAWALAGIIKQVFPQTHALWQAARDRTEKQVQLADRHAALRAELRRYFVGCLEGHESSDLARLLEECDKLSADAS